jgi:predicted ATPase
MCDAELHRISGDLFLLQGAASATVQASYEKALAISRRQQAKSYELRAAMSLSRLWQQQGKVKEAHELLSDVYGWFTEGFDTRDLQEARALLERLA